MSSSTFEAPRGTPVAEERARILSDPGFGRYFTDHMWVSSYSADKGWDAGGLEPYAPLTLDPAAAVFHYGQEIFEGLKAFKHADGPVWAFRPERNAARFHDSATRLALPPLPPGGFLRGVQELVRADIEWVPSGAGKSLYVRPFMIATEAYLGVRPSREAGFYIIASPAGTYFGGSTITPVNIWLSRHHMRAFPGGTGAAKCGGNYAASLLPQQEAHEHGCDQVLFLNPAGAVEELGGMNIFFIYEDGRILTPALTGSILPGVTRDSLLQLARDKGLEPVESALTIEQWRQDVEAGRIREAFACGTAAVIVPIASLRDGDEVIQMPTGAEAGVATDLRQHLLDIQEGRAADRHGWLHRLA